MDEQERREQFQPEEAEQVPQPAEGTQESKQERLTIVGIGASAGGLPALQSFFDAMPDQTGMAFTVVTHMDPEKESLLPDLLQRHTRMPVRQVTGQMPIEPDSVYVIPPGQNIVVSDTHLDVEKFAEPPGVRTPIDLFFRSLANMHHEAVAVILSGGGTDGAVGVKAIKEQGGLLMVQHPEEAEFDSMPRAAIATGLADVVLPVAQLAEKLVAYRQKGLAIPRDPAALTNEELEAVYRILTQVQVYTGHDFSQYKRSTILRRIQRRMQLHGYASLDAYLAYLRHEPGEAAALFNDLLIGVTNFFRDREAWEALAKQAMPRLFEGRGPGETVRVWSIGCATGEEAYTLAILLLEEAGRLGLPGAVRPSIQVFASDLDDAALHKAREGYYPEAIEADVSRERLERFFVKDGHYYRVRQELRDVVLFSNHSVLRDPPFSRLDLISCRNLLIYLNRELQENVFQIFHYALNPERYLFLGSSESAEMVHTLFRTTDKTHRIYQARPWKEERRPIPRLPLAVGTPSPRRSTHWLGQRLRSGEEIAASGALHHTSLEKFAPPSVLVDEQNQVLHVSETAGRYLLHPRGVLTSDLLKLVRTELQYELRTALFQAFEHNQSVLSHPVFVRFNGAPHRVVLGVRPYRAESEAADQAEEDTPGERLALVFFLEDESERIYGEAALGEGDGQPQTVAVPSTESQRDAMLERLEAELQWMRERLQATTEEYESSNEELKAANEELQSINEEYRSTTEELETSKEELQSVNEELQTVNNELKNKLEEISRAHSDLENLMVSTDIATLFLDRELRIQRYTPATAELFNIMAGDRGRPIAHLTNKLLYGTLVEDAEKVLRTLVPAEREVRDVEGRWMLVRVRPYRSVDNRIDGIVLTFVDISELKETEEALRQRETQLSSLAQSLEERVEKRTEQVRELAGQLTMAEHEERARIAEVLHDDLQQQLYSLQIHLEFVRGAAVNEELREEIEGMEKYLIAAMNTARQLSVDLSPPILEGEGLLEAIQWLSGQMAQQYQLDVQVRAGESLPALDRERRVLVFQMVRELLFNVVKHAGVKEAVVNLQFIDDLETGESYRIDVIDQGVGFEPDVVLEPGNARIGRGLQHMKERLRFVGGRFALDSQPGQGTRVTIVAPLQGSTETGAAQDDEEA